jgi:DNA polymerase I-like protein with 3'-5' exonuclease and polymerase domains
VHKIATIRDLITQLDPSKPVFFDTETGGPDYSVWVLGQIYQEHFDDVLVFEMKDTNPDILWECLIGYTLIGHNLLYDLQVLKKNCKNFKLPEVWEDTFYASRLVYPKWQKYSLDVCLTKVLGYDPYEKEGLNKKEMQKSFQPNETPSHAQLVYASVDVLLLPKLYHATSKIQGNFVYELDKLTANYATKIIDVGMPVDLDRLEQIRLSNVEEVKEAEQLLGTLNVNSYQQVRKLLGLVNTSDELTLRIITSRLNGIEGYVGEYKKGKVVIKGIVEPDYIHSEEKITLAKAIIKKRKALKRLNFVKRALDNGSVAQHGLHRITAHFSPHAITGRVQPSEENLSQYPRAMKEMWGVPEDSGRVLIYSDYSQLELRCITAILPERNMEKAYRNKIDLHSYAASNLDIPEDHLPQGVVKRFVAKQLNFLALYGGGKANFQRTVCKLSGVWLDMDMVVSPAFDQWKTGFSDIKDWHTRAGKSPDSMDKTISGRKYKATKYTDLLNIRNQGSGAEVFKLAIHYLMKHGVIRDDIYLVNLIHDAEIIDCPNDPAIYEPIAKLLALCKQAAWFAVMKQAPIKDLPMPVDVQVGYNWGDIEKGKNILYQHTLEGDYMLDKDIEEELKNVVL